MKQRHGPETGARGEGEENPFLLHKNARRNGKERHSYCFLAATPQTPKANKTSFCLSFPDGRATMLLLAVAGGVLHTGAQCKINV
jgi:hypothetical protein